MKLPVIKSLAETRSLSELKAAEEALLNEDTLPFDLAGEDEGEQLTHCLGAIWILEQVEGGMELKDAIRAFALRVRTSVS